MDDYVYLFPTLHIASLSSSVLSLLRLLHRQRESDNLSIPVHPSDIHHLGKAGTRLYNSSPVLIFHNVRFLHECVPSLGCRNVLLPMHFLIFAVETLQLVQLLRPPFESLLVPVFDAFFFYRPDQTYRVFYLHVRLICIVVRASRI